MAKLERNAMLNDLFINLQMKFVDDVYTDYINTVKDEMSKLFEKQGSISDSQIETIINRTPLDPNVNKTVIMGYIQAGIMNVLNTSTKNIPNSELGILAVVALLGKTGELGLTKSVSNITDAIIKQNPASLSTLDTKAYKTLDSYIKLNTEQISGIRTQFQDRLVKVNTVVKSNLSRNIIGRLSETKTLGLETRAITESFKGTDDTWRVKRVLETEIHTFNEDLKVQQGKKLGFTHKTWRTQRDGDVRHTNFHVGVANQKVLITQQFQAAGLSVDYPGDESLPLEDRINCRCYVILSK